MYWYLFCFKQLNDATQKAEDDLKDYKRLLESADGVSQKASRAQKKLQDLEQSEELLMCGTTSIYDYVNMNCMSCNYVTSIFSLCET